MPASSLTITDNRTGKAYEVPIANGAIRAMDLRQIRTDPDDFGLSRMTQPSPTPRRRSAASPRSTATAVFSLPRLSHRGAGGALQLSRGRLPGAARRAADPRRDGPVDLRHYPPHLGAREPQEAHGGLPLRRPRHGDARIRGGGAVHLLPRRRRTARIRPRDGCRSCASSPRCRPWPPSPIVTVWACPTTTRTTSCPTPGTS